MDYEVFYGKLSQWFKAKKIRLTLLTFIYKAFPNFVLVTYPLLLGYLIFIHDHHKRKIVSEPSHRKLCCNINGNAVFKHTRRDCFSAYYCVYRHVENMRRSTFSP